MSISGSILVSANALHLVFADYINERGEIAGRGLPPGVPYEDIQTRGHAFLLIPVAVTTALPRP